MKPNLHLSEELVHAGLAHAQFYCDLFVKLILGQRRQNVKLTRTQGGLDDVLLVVLKGPVLSG